MCNARLDPSAIHSRERSRGLLVDNHRGCGCASTARALALRLAQRCVLFAIWLRDLAPPPKFIAARSLLSPRKLRVKFLGLLRTLKLIALEVVRRASEGRRSEPAQSRLDCTHSSVSMLSWGEGKACLMGSRQESLNCAASKQSMLKVASGEACFVRPGMRTLLYIV